MKHLKFLFLLLLTFLSFFAKADEGMWLPQLLGKLNEPRMKSLGMKISAEDIYSINKGSLKDAIVSLGGFCTAEIISNKGLLLTNHHCGFDAIQNHSSLEHNYIRDGFWAKNNEEEMPNKGLFVTFIVRIEDVSKEVLAGISNEMSGAERQSAIDKNMAVLKRGPMIKEGEEGFIRGFFEANQYYLFITKTFRDIRLVGAPPSAIGNFGKDTDNWMWPRHTGDFSMFRIYASKNNEPAAYSPDNVPYVPKKSLSVSLDGVAENDFTMVFGFPGKTTEYLHSAAVEQIRTIRDPAKIAIRDKALNVIDSYMRKDEGIKIKYAAKYAQIQNAYKKWQGEVLGLTSTNAVGKKKAYEALFQKRVSAKPQWKENYGTLLADLETIHAAIKPFGLAQDYYTEITSKIELYKIAMQLNALVTAYNRNGDKGYNDKLKATESTISEVMEEYDENVDRSVFEVMAQTYVKDQPKDYVSPMLLQWLEASDGSYASLAGKVYSQKGLFSEAALKEIFSKAPADAVAAINAFDAIKLFADMEAVYQKNVQPSLNVQQDKLNKLQRIYMQAQMDVMTDKKFYPDANSTLRVAFGKVQGYTASNGKVKYGYYTDMDGLMKKYKPGDYEFDVPQKLQDLYKNKDYGRYGKNGVMPVCFIATNHTTGGNSGSPALDGYGNLIGLNFDRAWDGTMSDINYDPSICRNIMVDIRYVLFIIDKFAGATRLTDEMNIVYPKAKKKK